MFRNASLSVRVEYNIETDRNGLLYFLEPNELWKSTDLLAVALPGLMTPRVDRSVRVTDDNLAVHLRQRQKLANQIDTRRFSFTQFFLKFEKDLIRYAKDYITKI